MKVLYLFVAIFGIALSIRAAENDLNTYKYWFDLSMKLRPQRLGGNVVRGNGNRVVGTQNSVTGNENNLNGDANTMAGNENIHIGSNSKIEGSNNWSKGNNLKIIQNGYRTSGPKVNSYI